MGSTTYLDMLACEIGHLLREATCIVDGAWWHLVLADDTVFDGNAVIVLTEGGCLVDNTSTVLSSDVRVVHDAERSILKLKAI